MRYSFTWSNVNPIQGSPKTCRLSARLALIVVVLGVMLGCSSGGGDEMESPCGGPSVNNFMNTQVAEIIAGLTFTFMDGGLFQDTLSGNAVTVTLDTLMGTTLTLMLATQDHMASAEVELVGCNPFSQPACLFNVMVTASDFPSNEGPQMHEVLVLQDWRFTARVDNCANRINAHMIIEDAMGVAVPSASLDLSTTALCPMLCPGS